MKDSRVTLWTNPTTISADATTNGAGVALFPDGVAGDYVTGTGEKNYGYGVIVHLTPTGTAFNAIVRIEESDDDSTYYQLETLFDGDPVDLLVGVAIKIKARVRPTRKYIRLTVVTASMSGESLIVEAWFDDGTSQKSIEVHYA